MIHLIQSKLPKKEINSTDTVDFIAILLFVFLDLLKVALKLLYY